MSNLTLINSRQGSQIGNDCGGIITSTKQPSPGFLVMEEWKDVEGFEGYYQVSSHGRIKSLRRNHRMSNNRIEYDRSCGGAIRKQGVLALGYMCIGTCKNSIKNTYLVHRMVSIAFIPNPDNKPCVNHIDGNKTNNHVSNLEWCTYAENTNHAIKKGLMNYARGEKIYQSRLNEFQVRVIRKTSDLTHKELGEVFNISRSIITRIKNRDSWRHI